MASADADDESWLYGDGEKKAADPPIPGTESSSQLSADAVPFEPKETTPPVVAQAVAPVVVKEEPKEAETLVVEAGAGVEAEAGGEAEGEEDEEGAIAGEEDDDSEDDVQITIGAIKPQTSYEGTTKFKAGYQRPVGQAGQKQAPAKGVDVDAVGTVNGTPIFEFDLESVEDKPWRKPGADITDYFNYGFNEDTWQQYCEKQKRLRMENNSTIRMFTPLDKTNRSKPNTVQQSPTIKTEPYNRPYRRYDKYTSPGHNQPTTINVIGSTTRDTRRPVQQDFMESKEPTPYENPNQTPPPPGVPGVPPTVVSSYSQPPPSMSQQSVPPSVNSAMLASTQPILSMPPPTIQTLPTGPPPPTQHMVPIAVGFTGPPPPTTSIPPPGMMHHPTHMQSGPPPPGMMPTGPPPGMGPPGYGPPPRVNAPPPGAYPGGPPPFGAPPPSGPPPRGPPPSGYDDRPPPFGNYQGSGPPPPRYSAPPPSTNWDRSKDGRGDREWMDLPMSDDDISGPEDERGRRRRRERGRSRERSRSKDRRDRDRYRDRERDRHRSSRRDRERDRDRRDDDRSRHSSRSKSRRGESPSSEPKPIETTA